MNIISKRMGFLLSIFGTFVFTVNYISRFISKEPILLIDLNLLVLICTSLIFITSFFNIGKFVQVFGLAFATLVSIFFDPNDGVSYSLLALIVILMYKYGMLNKKPVIKFSIYVLVILLTAVAGSNKVRIEEAMEWPIKVIGFFLFFLAAIILIFYDEIRLYVQNEEDLKSEINNLNNTIEQTQGYIEKMEAKYINPLESGLTEKELVLLEALCIYRESNSGLGRRLGKSSNTVKVQLSKIMNKICVKTRHDLINHCRFHFINNCEKDSNSVKV